MRRSTLRLYGPFLALAIVQALFIVVSPSKAPDRSALSTGGAGGSRAGGAAGGGFASGTSGSAGDFASGVGGPGGVGGVGGSGGGGNVVSNVGGGTLAVGDITHCTGPYQFDILLSHGPPCQPIFGGDNGGSTSDGVTAETIKVVHFSAAPNAQVDAILQPKGLAIPEEEQAAAVAVFVEFINTHYELYGRKIELIRVLGKEGECPTSPPDYTKCQTAAQDVVKMRPFAVIWITSLYADVFDIWANAGIVALGGSAFDVDYYNGRRPFRYDVGMNGTQSADFISEYYCKKMVGRAPDHAGNIIHESAWGSPAQGNKNLLTRKLGVIVPEIPANVVTAQRVLQSVQACGGGDAVHPNPFTYESNINTAVQQTDATIAALAAAKITTVVCMCDPIAPVFQTKGLTAQRYYPEHVLPGLGLIDYDLLGQLYDPVQWQHAFGPSQLPTFASLDDSDPGRVWRAMGNSGHPCGNNGCGLPWAFVSELAIMLQQTGPNLNPFTFEQGVLTNIPPRGGAGRVALYQYGPDDYNGVSDEKEVYWSATEITPIDNTPGRYIAVGGDKRYKLGEWGTDLSGIPISPS